MKYNVKVVTQPIENVRTVLIQRAFMTTLKCCYTQIILTRFIQRDSISRNRVFSGTASYISVTYGRLSNYIVGLLMTGAPSFCLLSRRVVLF